MSRQLVESILSNNMLEANDMVEAKLAEIRDCKVYEMKRMFAAESKKDPNDPETWTGGRRAGPEFDAFLARNREKYQKNQGKKEAEPQPSSPKKPRNRKSPPKTEPTPPPEKVERDWKTSARLGIKRAKMRLNILKHVPGELARQSKEIAVKKGKDIVSDPMAAAASGTKLAAKGVKKTAKGTVKAIKRAASAPVMTDLKHIGFRNL